MPATTTGSKTVTHALAPHLTAAILTALLAKPVETLTVAQLHLLVDATKRVAHGENPSSTLGALFI